MEEQYQYDSTNRLTEQKNSRSGEQYDNITGQYYLRARYYNPFVERFTQEDVYHGDGLNLYVYCGANPVMYVEPSGYEKKCETGSESDKTTEVYYRTMSPSDYDYLRMTGELPATGETFISPTKAFSSDYDGVMVRFELNDGTTSMLEKIGLSNGDRAPLARAVYPNMSYVSGVKWTENFAFFKAEGSQINIGLGKGKALEIFNSNISTFKKVEY